MKNLSIIVPVYNEQESLNTLCEEIHDSCSKAGFDFEVLFIDDGSTDRSWSVISHLGEKYPGVRGYRMIRNYGKSSVLEHGFRMARGRVVITMDADLQDDPAEIPGMHAMISRDGFDMVSGWKKKRLDPWGKRGPSRLFNLVTRWVSGIQLRDFNCGFKAYRYDVVKEIHLYGEMHRYIPLLVKWAGYRRIGERVVNHRKRRHGKSKFGSRRFITGFLDLLTISFVSRFQRKPMHFFGTLGVASFLVGLGVAAFLILQKMVRLHRDILVREVVDQPMFFFGLVALIIGVQLFAIGFVGEMMVNQLRPGRTDYTIIEELKAKKRDAANLRRRSVPPVAFPPVKS